MIIKIKNRISRNLLNIPGWQTDRKIVVFESDDWGSIRTPSKGVLNNLLRQGIPANKCHYMSNDSLASESDLSNLMETLSTCKNIFGKNPVITANYIVANPNFKRIKDSGYKKYYHEDFRDTLKRYDEHDNAFILLKEGISKLLFYPQFHGREHLNILRWMRVLQNGSEETLKAFDYNMFGVSRHVSIEDRKSYMAALDLEDMSEIETQKRLLKDGLDLFEKNFRYRSSSFIPPNYTWHNELEEFLFHEGIKYIQGASVQRIPLGSNTQIKRHYLGQKNASGQTYMVRNCLFEPSSDRNKDWIDSCLSEIKNAFLWKKPAVIESHRVNYIGYINLENRDKNLILLKELLDRILRRWPEVEFINTAELGDLINSSDVG